MTTVDQVSALYEILLGRIPAKDGSLDRFKEINWIRATERLLESREYSIERTGRRRAKHQLSQEAVRTVAPLLGASDRIGFFEPDLTSQQFLESFFSPGFVEVKAGKKIRYVQTKSLPRSGHHFLISLLSKYFGDEAHYCESYKPAGCCRTYPCLRPFNKFATNKYMIQKSHDFKLSDTKLDEAVYVIQHRSPIARIQSNFELAIRHKSKKFVDTIESFGQFADKEIEYTCGFYNKWLASDGLEKSIVLYDELVDDTRRVLSRVIEDITRADVNAERLRIALEDREEKVNMVNSPSGIRNDEHYRFFDAGLYRDIESRIRDGLTVPVEIPFRYL